MAKPETKICKHCKTEIPYDAKICPNCRKRVKGGKLKWIIIVVVLLFIVAAASGGDDDDDGTKLVGTVGESGTSTESVNADAGDDSDSGDTDSNGTNTADADSEEIETEEVKTVYYVGDILMDGDMKIVYMSSGVYEDYSEYSQPDEGYEYIYLQFAFENNSESDDDYISSGSFNAYADGYEADSYYGGDDDLSATLSAGRSTTGYIYFTVPTDAEEIEIEYTTNYFTSDKITFVYEGEKDSGYVLEKDTTASENAYVPGDIITIGDLTITYISCEEDTSYSDYYEPEEGYHYITCTFEFENNGDGDEYISYFSFDCYADGVACDYAYFRDDGLSATISTGRKTKGTATFEVPDDATTVEMEFLDNAWTSSRAVFSCVY